MRYRQVKGLPLGPSGKTTPGMFQSRVALRFVAGIAAVPADALDCAQAREAIRAEDSAPGRYCGQGTLNPVLLLRGRHKRLV